jgi:Domain of unknown function (DUF4276)
MKASIIHVVVEDQLSARVAEKLIIRSSRGFQVGRTDIRRGFGNIKNSIVNFNQAAQRTPYLIITDLDSHPCPVEMRREWFTRSQHPNLIFRIAVREAEAWLLADRQRFADFLHVSKDIVTRDPENLPDPKSALMQIVSRSKKRNIREDILPEGDARIGPNYNVRLSDFVVNHWDIATARQNAPSLERAIRALETFKPV